MKALKRIFITVFILMIAATILCSCAGNNAPNGDISNTNVQEEGVDEADIVKINGAGYIFKAQRDGVTVSRMSVDGSINIINKHAAQGVAPREMFLYDDQYLIVINVKANVEQLRFDGNNVFEINYDTMVVNIYDVTDLGGSEIVLLRSDEFRGTYKTSRLTEGNMYLITNYNRDYGEAYVDYFDGDSSFDVAYYGEKGYDGIYSGGYLIAKLNLSLPCEKYQTALYADRDVYDIYCSKSAFYAMRRGWMRSFGCAISRRYYSVSKDARYGHELTVGIDRINLDTLEITGTASDFNGWSPDRFCLYDNGEYLFVANQKLFQESKKERLVPGNYLYVFDNEMNVTAVLGPLAQDETMYSARYDGDICYIVTAKRVITSVDPITLEPLPERFIDPLFKIDISNPLAPVLLGELEIEGFSTYMQSFGDGLLIGLGRGADGSELKVSLFDVSDDIPTEVNSIGMAAGAAEAEREARAILCEPEKNIFAFAARFDVANETKFGTLIFGLVDGELKQTAFLHEIEPDTDYSRKRVRRVARIGNHLLTVSDGYIVSYLLDDILQNGEAEPVDTADTRINKDDVFYTIKFTAGFDELSYPDRLVERGYLVTLPKPADIEDCWQFGYWAQNDASGREYFSSAPVFQNFALHAKWYKLPWRVVEFDLNLPSDAKHNEKYIAVPFAQTVEDGGRLRYVSYEESHFLIGRVIAGYKLTHWYKDDPAVAYDLAAPVVGSYTLYAYWEKITTHVVTLNYAYPDGNKTVRVDIVEDGKRVSAPIVNEYFAYDRFRRKQVYYELDGWYTIDGDFYNFSSPVSEDIVLVARWFRK